jgi:hypothetical protein
VPGLPTFRSRPLGLPDVFDGKCEVQVNCVDEGEGVVLR